VPADRAGLASGVNNTARQAGNAIGVAAFGALAGNPGGAGFIHGFHASAAIAAALLGAALVATATLRSRPAGVASRATGRPSGGRAARAAR
jgi:MFS transporter, DHA2 family, methylenomycin A resistance protein